MHPRSLVTQEWSVHAEVVFSHGDGSRPPATAAPGGDVRMEYTVRPAYGFQRGNILFTSTPPPPHVVYGTLPLRRGGAHQQQPYNRRCKSTCSIVLSDPPPARCGDPGCYHSGAAGASGGGGGSCEVCGGGRSPTSARRAAANTFTTHFCTRLPEKPAPQRQQQDASSQTDFGEDKLLQVPEADRKVGKRLSRSPARLRGRSPLLQRKKSQASQSPEAQDAPRKPRTVHIDVYCTGSDASASSGAETTEDSSPQTVYESEQYRVVRTRAGKGRLPRAFQRGLQGAEGFDSDDGLSSPYPSEVTASSSLTRLEALGCSSAPESLAQSDSFEYADASDRLRIREKERAWGEGGRTWRSPDAERKFLMQRGKRNDFLEASSSKDSCSFLTTDTDEDDDTGDAWSFVGSASPRAPLRRESTVRKGPAPPAKPEGEGRARRFCDAGSLSDSGASSLHRFAHRDAVGPFGARPPSPPASKVESCVTAPFAADRLSRARRFGAVVRTLRKPGHHEGPSKNPDCSCVHCRKFYEDGRQRGRARSVGEVPQGGSSVSDLRDFVRGLGKETDSDAGTPV